MIEILFGESEAGGMKIALRRRKMRGDVIGLPLMLDIGDISKPVLSAERRDLLFRMLYSEQYGADDEMKAELQRLGASYSRELLRLKEHLKNNEDLRIWYSDAAYSICGMLWLCSKLLSYKGKIYTVKLPRFIVKGNTAVEYSGWGEIGTDMFAEMLKYQRKMSQYEIHMNALCWDRQKCENAPLRAVVNGSVIGVSEDFYDFLIWKYLGKEPIREAMLIGRILGENRLGISDWWYAYRIDKFIQQGNIEIVENSDKKYERLIRSTQN